MSSVHDHGGDTLSESRLCAKGCAGGGLRSVETGDLGPFNVAACVAYCGSLTKPAAAFGQTGAPSPLLRFWAARRVSYCVARRAAFNADDETTRRGKLELECSEDKSGWGPTHGLQRIWIPARRRACLVKNVFLLAAVLCCPCGFHEHDHLINCNGTGQPEPAVAQEVVRCNARTAFLLLVQSLVVFAAVTSARDWSAYSASHCEGFLTS
jgi:hypothetical protein